MLLIDIVSRTKHTVQTKLLKVCNCCVIKDFCEKQLFNLHFASVVMRTVSSEIGCINFSHFLSFAFVSALVHLCSSFQAWED